MSQSRPVLARAAVALFPLLLSASLSASAMFLAYDERPFEKSGDLRVGSQLPDSGQLALVGAMGAEARWNRFGTVHSLVKRGGYLATGLTGTPVEAARKWVKANRALFRLSESSVDALEVVNEGAMPYSDARAVLFRQKFGSLRPTHDGLITVGIVGGKVYYVSSSSAGDQAAPASATLSPQSAWMRAAADVNRRVNPADILRVTDLVEGRGWNVLNVKGFVASQRARLVALPLPAGGVVPAYETIVMSAPNEVPFAYVHFVDARTGDILIRENRLYHQTGGTSNVPISGSLPDDGSCAERHDIEVPDGSASINVVATAVNVANDIFINLYYNDIVVASGDLLTSPETLSYAPASLPSGTYQVEICSYDGAAPLPPTNYAGVVSISDTATPSTGVTPYPPKWRWFPTTPDLDYSASDVRTTGCWETVVDGAPVEGCEYPLANLASRLPWDVLPQTGLPTFLTIGNNAETAEGWIAVQDPLLASPNGQLYRPSSPTREYIYDFTNAWNESGCSQSNFVPTTGNDISASVTNLFTMHNRMHDWSYFLGWTEQNYNLQLSNFGLTDPNQANDPEIGTAQAGAISGSPGTPAFLLLTGRDNANQVALQDGVPAWTNQYLFQPIGGLLYAPCVDGGLDMGIAGHEFTHATTNRMIGGPDQNIGGEQGGSMGESWSDLAAAEHQFEFGFPIVGGIVEALGAYATGNKEKGIRDFALNDNPLNYSNMGFDTPGPEVHADGEIWNGTQWALRQAFVDQYESQFAYGDVARQRACAEGQYPPQSCAGNRRWIQLMFDSFLLMPAAPSMLDARDAMLAADVARFGGANQALMWKVFATRGMGTQAYSAGSDDVTPIANFESPMDSNPAVLTFSAVAGDEGNTPITNAKLFVGQFTTRSRWIADTDPATVVDESSDTTRLQTLINADTARLVPGTYDFIVVAPGYGIQRYTKTLTAGANTFKATLPTNWASLAKGGSVTTSATDDANIALKDGLIDDSEDTGARFGDNGTVEGSYIVVQLGGGAHSVSSVNISTAAGPNNAGRFTGLRSFEIRTCNGSCADPSADFGTVVYTSAADAFASYLIRPVQPDLTVKSFSFPATTATHVMLRALTNQCTGNPLYAGEQDSDPLNDTDCATAAALTDPTDPTQLVNPPAAPGAVVRATELQVFTAPAPGSVGGEDGGSGGGGGGGGSGGSGGGSTDRGGGSLDLLLLLPLLAAARLRRKRIAAR